MLTRDALRLAVLHNDLEALPVVYREALRRYTIRDFGPGLPEVVEAHGAIQTAMASWSPLPSGALFYCGHVALTPGASQLLDQASRQAALQLLAGKYPDAQEESIEHYLDLYADRLLKAGRAHQMMGLVLRAQDGDWGEVDPQDRQANSQALLSGERLMGVYEVESQPLWLLVEWDRSLATLLLPSEY